MSFVVDWNNGYWKNPAAPKQAAEIAIASDWAPIRGYKNLNLFHPSPPTGGCKGILSEIKYLVKYLAYNELLTIKPMAISLSQLAYRILPNRNRVLSGCFLEQPDVKLKMVHGKRGVRKDNQK